MKRTASSLMAVAALAMAGTGLGAAARMAVEKAGASELEAARRRIADRKIDGGRLTYGGLLATRSGKPGTVAQAKRASIKSRNRARNKAAHRG